ncbi:MAG: hypothetical protein N3A63_07905 [Bacteroidetes bacterium]|nr:hypothetical protein [Bacteroidota bacterium]
MVVARAVYYLSPVREGATIDYDPEVPYTGEIYINRGLHIEYGVTQIISSDAILSVLESQHEYIRKREYDISTFFTRHLEHQRRSVSKDTIRINPH